MLRMGKQYPMVARLVLKEVEAADVGLNDEDLEVLRSIVALEGQMIAEEQWQACTSTVWAVLADLIESESERARSAAVLSSIWLNVVDLGKQPVARGLARAFDAGRLSDCGLGATLEICQAAERSMLN